MKPTSYQKAIALTAILLSILACSSSNLSFLLSTATPPPPTIEAPIMPTFASGPYDENAIAQDDIDAALRLAPGENKLVLLDFGANWCADCLVLSKLFEDPAVQPYLQENFHVVQINVGYWDKNLDITQKYGNPIEKGIPAVVVLTSSGEPITSTKDGSLANARSATAAEILNYLKAWVAKKP